MIVFFIFEIIIIVAQKVAEQWKSIREVFARVTRKICLAWTVNVKMTNYARDVFERAFFLYYHISRTNIQVYHIPENKEPKVWSDFESDSELLDYIPDCPELAQKKDNVIIIEDCDKEEDETIETSLSQDEENEVLYEAITINGIITNSDKFAFDEAQLASEFFLEEDTWHTEYLEETRVFQNNSKIKQGTEGNKNSKNQSESLSDMKNDGKKVNAEANIEYLAGVLD